MKKYAFNELTILQYIFVIHGTQVGIGVMSIPRELADVAGTDGWIAILIGWVLAMAASLLITNIMKRFPDHTIIDLVALLLGKWPAKAFACLIALYCGFGTLAVFGNTVAVLNVWLLSQTPAYVIVILLVIPFYQIMHNGVRVLGRYSELIFYLSLWVPFVLLTTLKEAYWVHLLPFLKEGWWPVLMASKTTILSFLGFELSFFLYPFLQKKQYASIGIVVANTLSMLVFLYMTVFCYIFFSPDEISQYTWPTLNLWKVIEFRFLERIDILFLAFYLFVLSTTALPYLYFTVFSSSQLVGKSDHRPHLRIFLLVLIAFYWFYTPSYIDLKKWTHVWSLTGMCGGYVLPVLLWLPAWLKARSFRRQPA